MGDNCSIYSALVRPQPHSCVQAQTMHFTTDTAADKFKTAQLLNRGTKVRRDLRNLTNGLKMIELDIRSLK